jgi:hypothetical protein
LARKQLFANNYITSHITLLIGDVSCWYRCDLGKRDEGYDTVHFRVGVCFEGNDNASLRERLGLG